MKKALLQRVEWPDFGQAEPLPPPALAELEERLARLREKMQQRGLTHLAVYGDREHLANLMYLIHFDPRFEEALLIVRASGSPLLLVGNECVGHLPFSPLYTAGGLRYERFQSFSLLNQPRDESRPLSEILSDEGIVSGARVGCVGWKYFTPAECAAPATAIDLPAYLADALRTLCGHEAVTNATDLLMSPSYGLRTSCSVYEIASFEYANVVASEGMRRVLQQFRAGATDFELMRAYEYAGQPLCCHPGMKSSGNLSYGLSSPVGSVVRKGDPCSTNIGYWGSNICRAGWVAFDETDLPEAARDYVASFAAPYFEACYEWYRHLRIGTPGKTLRRLIDERLPFDRFGVFLNPGHLIHFDEWVSSPIYKDSEEVIRSGMCIQVDIIPRSATYSSSRMEEGVVIADAALRRELAAAYPAVYDRCMRRRRFMTEVLGFDLPDEVLPLSNIPGIVPPFFLNSSLIFTMHH